MLRECVFGEIICPLSRHIHGNMKGGSDRSSTYFHGALRGDYVLRRTDSLTDPLKTLAETFLAQHDTRLKGTHSDFSKTYMKSVNQRRNSSEPSHRQISSFFLFFSLEGCYLLICNSPNSMSVCLDRIRVYGYRGIKAKPVFVSVSTYCFHMGCPLCF